jgi:growth factor-regulated tyrosine kinase substrate
MKLGHLGIEQEVRVCDGCEKKLSDLSRRSNSISRPTINGQRATGSISMMSGRSQEELDFEQAIAMSLAESGSASQHNTSGFAQANSTNTLPGVGYGYEPRPSQPPAAVPGSSDTESLMPSKQLESEDPDLAAAIRASLAEVAAAQRNQPIATTSSAPYHASAPPTSSYSYTPQQPAAVPSVPSYELAMAEFDALDSFSNALARNAQHIAPDDANELFYRADRHRGKMMRAMQDADVKSQTLFELNQKLQRAVRLYDALLERSIGQYQRPMHNGYQSMLIYSRGGG